MNPPITHAENQDVRVLIIYDGPEELKDEVYKIDSLVGHFTSDITIHSTKDDPERINDFTHVIYLGLNEEEPSSTIVSLLDSFNGPIFHIGQHMEAFQHGSFLHYKGKTVMTHMRIGEDVRELKASKIAFSYDVGQDAIVYYEGISNNESFPLLFSYGHNYYAAIDTVSDVLQNYLGETLFSFFNVEKGLPLKAVRLEDIHPRSDVKLLKEIAKYLWEEQIPYMITVIPVYTNPETGEEVHLADEPEFVRVLQYMQNHGASIILHGYRHQYRDTETGEGFEYWDEKYDRPIYQEKDELVLTREDFATAEEYNAYVQKGLEFESAYIHRTISQGVKELVEQGLYPLAFEPPHYAMSLSGYKELSNYFSTFVGQTQISNQSDKISFTPLYESEPVFLHGMKLLPETLGYVDPKDGDAHRKIKDEAAFLSQFSDSYLAFFYHPYLGLDGLKSIIEEMKKYNEFEWLELKKMENRVAVDNITITSQAGKIQSDSPFELQIMNTFKKMWWVIFPAAIFLGIIFYSTFRKKVKKR